MSTKMLLFLARGEAFMDTMALEKQRLREECLAARETLSEQERCVLDESITQKLLATPEYAETTTVLTYVCLIWSFYEDVIIERPMRWKTAGGAAVYSDIV